MSSMLVPNDGVRGIDIETKSGTVKYNADRSGKIVVDNPQHAKALRDQGFTVAGHAAGFKSRFGTWLCRCEKYSFDYQIKCVHCGTDKSEGLVEENNG